MATALVIEQGIDLPDVDIPEHDWENMVHLDSAVVPSQFEGQARDYVIANEPTFRVLSRRETDQNDVRIWFVDVAIEGEGRKPEVELTGDASRVTIVGVEKVIPVAEQGAGLDYPP